MVLLLTFDIRNLFSLLVKHKDQASREQWKRLIIMYDHGNLVRFELNNYIHNFALLVVVGNLTAYGICPKK